MTDITKDQVIQFLSDMPVIQLAEMIKVLEEKWGVKAAPPATGTFLPGEPIPGTPAVPEKTEFTVELKSVPADKKIAVIKVVREISGLGLKEDKDLVDGAPKTIKEGANRAESDEMKKKLEDAGAKIEVS